MAKECSNSSCSKESCEGCPSKAGQGKPDFHIDLNADSSIKHVIGVVSGKGGVGKSMVTASLANQKAKEGYKVGILDADITGPSIPKMYGLKGPANVDDKGVYPAVAANGVKVMSINLLLPGEEEPVIWRGPVIAGTVKQFWTDVIWGDLDYLFVDMPPGTGDVPLTVFQSIPVDGIITVTSPQDLVSLIVNKGTEGYLRVKLDTENYRERRKETLETLAKNIAYKVKRTRRPVSLEPMNPYERRIIHAAVQNDKYVTTRSEGEEPFRHVVIALKKEAVSGERKGRYDRAGRGRSYGYKGNNRRGGSYQTAPKAEPVTETVSESTQE